MISTREAILLEAEREGKRLKRRLYGLAAAVALLLLVVVYILTQYQVETACEKDPSGSDCQQLKITSDLYRTSESACVITIIAGLGCPALDENRRQGERHLEQLGRDPNGGTDVIPDRGGGAGRPDTPDPSDAPGAVDSGDGGATTVPPPDNGGTPPPGGGGGHPTDPGTDQSTEPTLGDQLGETIDSVTAPGCERLPRTCDVLELP